MPAILCAEVAQYCQESDAKLEESVFVKTFTFP